MPLQIAAVAARFPELMVVLGHSGIKDMWPTALAAAQRYANIVLCLCGTAPCGIQQIVSEIEPERLQFGTDVGFGSAAGTREYRMGQILRLDIPDNDKALILGESARQLYGL
jgi:predicted TIM-barrel fold metal-dependent hydrolase